MSRAASFSQAAAGPPRSRRRRSSRRRRRYRTSAGHRPHRDHPEVGVVGRLPIQYFQQQRAVWVHRGFGFADLPVIDRDCTQV